MNRVHKTMRVIIKLIYNVLQKVTFQRNLIYRNLPENLPEKFTVFCSQPHWINTRLIKFYKQNSSKSYLKYSPDL